MRKFLLAAMALFLMVNQAWATTQWRDGTGANSLLGSSNASDIDSGTYNNIVSPLDSLLANYRQGCAISYVSASSISVGIGEVTASNSDGSIRLFAKNTTATTCTFANIDTGSESPSVYYYVYAYMAAASDTTFTVKLSTSSTAPSGCTYYKRLGYIYNDSSSNISADKVVNDNNYYALKLGDWVAKSVNVEYTASTDGQMLGSVSKTANSDGSVTAQTPTGTVRQKAGAYPNGNYDYATFNSPIKKGNTYKLVSSGTVTVDYYFWIPSEN